LPSAEGRLLFLSFLWKLRELLPSLDSPNEHIFINERKSIQDFVEKSMKYLEEKEIL
jgi:hypothetical protein